MKNKIIAAALKEMEIHSLRFTMEDLTRRLHIGKNSLYKIVSSKDALIKSVIEYKTTHFAETEEKILSSATCRACIPTFGRDGKIFIGAIRKVILSVLFETLGSAKFLSRTNFSYKEATDTVGDLVLYGLKAR